ncbi:MAG TPA: extracellular solute-binding protein [Halanaerobiales bacterium]|nr:extracellular solute-binding protein [Halanaerobiales bacterium]
MATLRVLLIITDNEKNDGSILQDKFLEFEKRENIEIKTTFVSWNRAYENIIMAFKEGNAPDVLQIGTTWLRTIAHLGYLSKTPDIKVRKPLTKWIENCCFYQGKRIGVPWLTDAVAIAARQDIMKKLDITKEDIRDWSGFYNICKYIKEKRINNRTIPQPLAFTLRPEMGSFHRFSSWLFAQGDSYPSINPLPDKFLSKDSVIKVFEYLPRLLKACNLGISDIDKHPYQLDDDFYENGSYVFFIRNWNGMINDLFNPPGKGNNKHLYTVLPIPIKDPEKGNGAFGGGSVLSVSSNTNYPDKAWNLVEYMISDEFTNQWIKLTGEVPAYEADFWRKRFSDPRIDTMYKIIVNSQTYPLHPAWPTLEELLHQGISSCLWRIIEDSSNLSIENIIQLLKKTDRDIINILKICWGVEQ